MVRLIICIDGLGKDLITKENSPFLYNYGIKNSLCTLKTFFAFTEEYSFFSGQTPKEHNKWMEFKKSNKSIFSHFLVKLFSFNKKIRNNVAGLLQYLYGRKWIIGTHQIPQTQLNNFDSCLKDGLWELPFFKNKNFAIYKWPLFALRDKEKSEMKLIFKYENDEERLNRLLLNDVDIYYTQLMMMDKTMHKYGKNSVKTKKSLKEMDKIIEKTVNKFLEKNPKGEVILWSDHGFADIKNVINLEEYLPEMDKITYFIAGTTAHFWFKNKNDEKLILENIKRNNKIKILTKKLADKYKIPFNSDYGDLCLFVEKGDYFFPNFYQKYKKEKYKGMHGYPDDKEMDGFFIINKKIKNKILNMEGAIQIIKN